MKKLEAYKQAVSDLNTAKEILSNLDNNLCNIKISVNSSITINSDSSDKQYIYAISILNNQIKACEELDLDSTEYMEAKQQVLETRKLSDERKAWYIYYHQLIDYKSSIYNLLDDKELFSLLETPVKP
jgi:hypothetical protein